MKVRLFLWKHWQNSMRVTKVFTHPGWECTIEIPTTNSGITAANNFISHKYS